MEELAKEKHVFQAARIKPLLELNGTAASVASSNNEMPNGMPNGMPIHTKKILQNAGGRKI